jgi:hypothetical protein
MKNNFRWKSPELIKFFCGITGFTATIVTRSGNQGNWQWIDNHTVRNAHRNVRNELYPNHHADADKSPSMNSPSSHMVRTTVYSPFQKSIPSQQVNGYLCW